MSTGLDQAIAWLLERQNPEGWWRGWGSKSASSTAQYVLFRRLLGLDLNDTGPGLLQHLLHLQRKDGGWALHLNGPADLSTTLYSYLALRVLGQPATAESLVRAREIISRLGGIDESGLLSKLWLALFGLYPWDQLPALRPGLLLIPGLKPPEFSSFWENNLAAPLLIISSCRAIYPLGVEVVELTGDLSAPNPPLQRERIYRPLIEKIITTQGKDGLWGRGEWLVSALSLIALRSAGVELEHPSLQRGLRALETLALKDSTEWRLVPISTPILDTSWAIETLIAAGLNPQHQALRKASKWLIEQQVPPSPGNGLGRGSTGGWSEFRGDAKPDPGVTAVTVSALLKCGTSAEITSTVMQGVKWITSNVTSSARWPENFHPDFRIKLLLKDLAMLISPRFSDFSPQILRTLIEVGIKPNHHLVQSGLDHLARRQRGRGYWSDASGHIYRTWSVISALSTLETGSEMRRRAASWLISRQNPDGGWGESCYAAGDSSFAGIGKSSPLHTAWAVLGLQLSGMNDRPAYRRGLDYLCSSQVKGSWEESLCPSNPPELIPQLANHIFPTLALAYSRNNEKDTRLLAATPNGGTSDPSTDEGDHLLGR